MKWKHLIISRTTVEQTDAPTKIMYFTHKFMTNNAMYLLGTYATEEAFILAALGVTLVATGFLAIDILRV